MSTYGSWYYNDLPIRADDDSVTQFCTEKGYGSPLSYTSDGGRFSNDGGVLMNYYSDDIPFSGSTISGWVNLFGYDPIVTSITT